MPWSPCTHSHCWELWEEWHRASRVMLHKASADPAWLVQRGGEWNHGYLRETLQKHFASVLLTEFPVSGTEFSISGAELGKLSQHTSSALSEVVNLCEIRSLMQGSNCESTFRSSQWFSDYCELESIQRCLEASVQCCQASLWSRVVHLLAYPSVLTHYPGWKRASGSQMHYLFVQMHCEFQLHQCDKKPAKELQRLQIETRELKQKYYKN